MKHVLKFINKTMQDAGFRYQLNRYDGEVIYPYYVGSYIETAADNETGHKQIAFTIDGFTRGDETQLIEDASRLEEIFDPVNGLHEITEDGISIVATYEGSQPVPVEDMDLKRMQISLQIQVWP